MSFTHDNTFSPLEDKDSIERVLETQPAEQQSTEPQIFQHQTSEQDEASDSDMNYDSDPVVVDDNGLNMDVVQKGSGSRGSNVEIVYRKLHELTDNSRKLIMEQDPALYPDQIPMGKFNDQDCGAVASKELFDLRGSHIKWKILPEPMNRGHMTETVLVAGSQFAGKHFEISFERAAERDIAYIGSKTKGKAKEPVQQKAPPPRIPPPKEEVVEVMFHTDSQMPNIEVLAFDLETNRTISTRIFASEMEWDPQGGNRVAFEVKRYEPDPTVDHTQERDQPVNESEQLLEKMAQSFEGTCVMEVSISLNQPMKRRAWVGVAEPHLNAIRASPNRLLLRDNLITCLDEPNVKLYFTSKSSNRFVSRWVSDFRNYMRDIFSIAKYHGNFWFYRWQCMQAHQSSNAGIGTGSSLDIHNTTAPAMEFIIPRWLVREWKVNKRTTHKGKIILSNHQTWRYEPLKLPTEGYSCPDETAFLLRLVLIPEQKRQLREQLELVRTENPRAMLRWDQDRFQVVGPGTLKDTAKPSGIKKRTRRGKAGGRQRRERELAAAAATAAAGAGAADVADATDAGAADDAGAAST